MKLLQKKNKCLYFHINSINLKVFYVGIGNKRRAFYKKRNEFWHNIVNKYEYFVDIICENLTWEEACILEEKYIKHFGRRDLGLGSLVNLTNGGEGSSGRIITEKTKLKRKLRYEQRTKEEKEKSNEKRRIASLKHKHTEESKAKMRLIHQKLAKEKIISEKTREKMRLAKLGNSNKKGKLGGKAWNKGIYSKQYIIVNLTTGKEIFKCFGFKRLEVYITSYNVNKKQEEKINRVKLKQEKKSINFKLIINNVNKNE